MSWQAYKNFRFRKTRENLYRGNVFDSFFPLEPGLVSIFFTIRDEDPSSVSSSIAKLLSQTYENIEFVILGWEREKLRDLISDLSIQGKEKIKLFPFNEVLKRDETHYPAPRGEFSSWPGQDCHLEANYLERMVSTLHNKPHVDMVYFQDTESINPLTNFFLIRSRVMWSLGVNPEPFDPPENTPYWQQAGLVLNIKTFDLSETSKLDSHLLFNQLKSSCTDRDRILYDFSRDFYLTPWVCYLWADRINHRSSRLLNQLKQTIRKSGNVLYEGMEYKPLEVSGSWTPTVFIHVTETPQVDFPVPLQMPPDAFTALVNLSPGEMPNSISTKWKVCLTLGKASLKPPLLKSAYQGWMVSEKVSSLVNLLDFRIHAHYSRVTRSFITDPRQASLKVSVIISTYHRETALRGALQSIARQTFPLESFEVIVVNNDPQDDRVGLLCEDLRLEGFRSYPGHLRLIQCPLPGLSHARNAGISEARGEVICFLDDDAAAGENWLEQIWQAFSEHSRVGVIGGHITLKYPAPRPKILKEGLERFWGQFITSYDRYTEVNDEMDFPWGGNWCARRKVLFEIGGFRGLYGKHRRDFSGGEEIIAAILAQKLGYTIAILPAAVVEHRPDSTRFNFRYLSKTITSQIIIRYRMNRDLYLPKTVSVANNIRGLKRFVGNIWVMLRLPRKEREALVLEYSCYIIAWSRLFFEQMGDGFSRLWYRE
jgi:glycosyltransferase involved in cell wall biosynthesis